MTYQPSPYDLGLTDDPDTTWQQFRQDQADAEPPEPSPTREERSLEAGWRFSPAAEGYGEVVGGMDDADMAADQAEILGDRYSWAEAEATKPDRYRTAQLDQADREAEL